MYSSTLSSTRMLSDIRSMAAFSRQLLNQGKSYEPLLQYLLHKVHTDYRELPPPMKTIGRELTWWANKYLSFKKDQAVAANRISYVDGWMKSYELIDLTKNTGFRLFGLGSRKKGTPNGAPSVSLSSLSSLYHLLTGVLRNVRNLISTGVLLEHRVRIYRLRIPITPMLDQS